MPKKEFFNLDAKKQETVLNAARKEFTSMLYEDASINMIVKEANISRGSFYCYFENKKDVYMYVMRLEIMRIVDNLVIAKNKKKISLFDACLKLYDQVVEYYNADANRELMRNILCNMRIEFEKDAIGITPQELVAAIKSRVSLDGINYKSDEEIFSVAGMVIHFIVEAVFLTVFKNIDSDLVRKELQFRLKIIEKGVEKR